MRNLYLAVPVDETHLPVRWDDSGPAAVQAVLEPPCLAGPPPAEDGPALAAQGGGGGAGGGRQQRYIHREDNSQWGGMSPRLRKAQLLREK
jgi:hypothetical protein